MTPYSYSAPVKKKRGGGGGGGADLLGEEGEEGAAVEEEEEDEGDPLAGGMIKVSRHGTFKRLILKGSSKNCRLDL